MSKRAHNFLEFRLKASEATSPKRSERAAGSTHLKFVKLANKLGTKTENWVLTPVSISAIVILHQAIFFKTV